MERRPTTVVAPPGYAERVALALRALPGDGPERAARLGVTLSYLYQAQRGHRGWRDAAGLAAACGVPEVLLVYGPTGELRRALGDEAARYDRVVSALAVLDASKARALVNPATLDLLKREETRRRGTLTVRLPGGAYVFAGVEVESSPSVPAGAVEAVPVGSP